MPIAAGGNCQWLDFDAGLEVACSGIDIMTGFCDSLDSSGCGLSDIQVKCCTVAGLVVDIATCGSFVHQDGEQSSCETFPSSTSNFLVATCGSLDVDACNGGAATFTVSFVLRKSL